MDKLRWVLDRQEQDIVRLNDYLLSRLDDIVPITTVMHDLEWSRYRVLSTLDALVNDLTFLQNGSNEDDKYQLFAKVIKIDHSVQINTLALEYEYRQRSIAWLMLLEMLTEQVDSYETFAERHNVSVAVVRAAKQKIQDAFTNQDIEVSKNNRIVGNEVIVRSFFMQLMRYYHAQIETSLIQSTREEALLTETLIEELLKIYDLPQDVTSHSVISLQVLIWLVRVQNGHQLHEYDLPKLLKPQTEWPKAYQELAKKLVVNMKQVSDLPDHVLRTEADFAVLALFTSGLVTDFPQAMLTTEAQKHINSFKHILEQTYQQFFHQTIDPTIEEQVYQATLSSNLRTMYFMKDLVQSSVDIGVLESNFPIHARFVGKLMKNIAEQWTPDEQRKFIRVQFENYFNSAIMYLQPKLIVPPVRVAIGFTYHPMMRQLVCEQLAHSRNINFEFVEIGTEADLYISDIPLEGNVTVPGYIWNIYPDNHTLDQFMQDALQVAVKHFKNSEY